MPDARLQRTREAYRPTATDGETGIAIRYVQSWDISRHTQPPYFDALVDAAWWLAWEHFFRSQQPPMEPSDDDLWGV